MKKIPATLFSIGLIKVSLFATIADDLTIEIKNNDVLGVIATIDSASNNSVSLSQMLAYARAALENTASSDNSAPFINAAWQYLSDFYSRPMIDCAASTVLWVDQSLFLTGQIGSGYNAIMTQDRLIFPTIQQAMSYLDYVKGGTWTVVVNQAIYDENITIPAGQAITLTGVGGVITGNGAGASFSSTDAFGAISWTLNDSQNIIATPSLTLQSVAFGYGGYRYMPYMSNITIGNVFTTTVTGLITSSPTLIFTSLYAFSGMGVSPADIGPIHLTLNNFRTGGAINFTSASIQAMNTSTIVPSIVAANGQGNISDVLLYDSITLTNGCTGLVKDCVFGQSSKIFTAQPTLFVNKTTNYWLTNKTWTLGSGAIKTVEDQ